MTNYWLICGSRKKNYKELVFKELDKLLSDTILPGKIEIIEGCCPNSADVYAEEWAKKNDISIHHHPAVQGGYLKRNIEMVNKSDLVIAFWDGFSYGTSHTISHAVLNNKKIIIIPIK